MLAPAAHLVVLEKCVAVVFLQARLAVAHRTVGTVRLGLHAAPPTEKRIESYRPSVVDIDRPTSWGG